MLTTSKSSTVSTLNKQQIIPELVNDFKEHFEEEPTIFFAPGRVNFLGEHVDYNDGIVLPMAIDNGIYFAITKSKDSKIHCIAQDLDETFQGTIGSLEADSSWSKYILGVSEILGLDEGYNCVFKGTVPLGAGLSSSAALCSALAFALNDLFELGKTPMELALVAQKTENEYAGVNCGLMDQVASLLSKKGFITWFDCQSHEVSYLPLEFNGYQVVLFDTQVTHELSNSEYNTRIEECESALAKIRTDHQHIASYRDTAPKLINDCEDLLSEKEYKRALYVSSEIERVLSAPKLLEQDNIQAFGDLMYSCHEGLRDDFEVSCLELDLIVDLAKKQEVTGARMMGGGFGGCVITLIKDTQVESVIAQITEAYNETFDEPLKIYKVAPSNGAHKIEHG